MELSPNLFPYFIFALVVIQFLP